MLFWSANKFTNKNSLLKNPNRGGIPLNDPINKKKLIFLKNELFK